jgi:hypothetical protein
MQIFRVLCLTAFLLATAVLAEAQQTAKPIFALGVQEPVTNDKCDGGLLLRELARQALLIAARDELGLPTRDQTLREPFPPGVIPVQMKTKVMPGQAMEIEIFRTEAGADKVLFTKSIPLDRKDGVDYEKVIVIMAELSRTEFPDTLTKAGFLKQPKVAAAQPQIPAEVQTDLNSVRLDAQFSALRFLHEAVANNGATPELIAGLVRAYSNLGVLTQFHWNASHKAFKARSLLYAQRLMDAKVDGKTPGAFAMLHRAHARILAGMHAIGLTDLTAALALAKDENLTMPFWAPSLEHICRYNIAALKTAATTTPEGSALFLLWAYMTVEGGGSQSAQLEMANILFNRQPECFFVIDSASSRGGISTLHQTTTLGLREFAKSFPKRLNNIPSLPDEVKKMLPQVGEDIHATEKVFSALLKAADEDTRDPSWAVLERLFEETAFAQIARRGFFMRYLWSVDTDEFITEAAPLVATHPYRFVIESYASKYEQDAAGFDALFKNADIVDAERTEMQVVQRTIRINTAGKRQGRTAARLTSLHTDALARDMEQELFWISKAEEKTYAHTLFEISPHCPRAIGMLIMRDWPFAQKYLQEWEKNYLHQSDVLAALARKYAELNKPDDSIKYLRLFMEKAKDQWAYDMLADNYLRQGKMDLWQATLEDSLKLPDAGLTHAQVQVKIARQLMTTKQWDKALPFALAAAETWAEWAMVCAAECYEGMNDMKNAEVWLQRISERYRNSSSKWLMWCKRTGQGRVAEAQELAMRHAKSLSSSTAAGHHEESLVISLFGNDLDSAAASAKRAFTINNNPWTGMHLALIYASLKKDEDRNAVLKSIAENGAKFKDDQNKTRDTCIAVAALMQKSLTDKSKLDSAEIEKQITASHPAEAVNLLYFLGKFAELYGTPEEAAGYMDRAASAEEYAHKWNCLLAREWLRAKNIKPGDIKRTKPGEADF